MPENGKIAYAELAVADLPKARTFYEAAFGWRFTDYGPTYAAFSDSGLEGGLQGDTSEESAPKAPLLILYADDLEGMQAKVEAAGGVVTVPIFSFPGGRRFHFKDPGGNELAVYTDA
jgi:hypothetical protein